MKKISEENNIALLKELCDEYGYELLIDEEGQVVCKVEGSDDEDDIYRYDSVVDALISWKDTLIESDKCNDEPVWEEEMMYIASIKEELPIIYGEFSKELYEYYFEIYKSQNKEVDRLMESLELRSGEKVKAHIPVEVEYDKSTDEIKRVSIGKVSFLKRLIFDGDTSEIERDEMDEYDKNGLIEEIKFRPISDIGEKVMFYIPVLCLFDNQSLSLMSVDYNKFFK